MKAERAASVRPSESIAASPQQVYARRMEAMQQRFESAPGDLNAGAAAITERAAAVDDLARTLWSECAAATVSGGEAEVALLAVGGYGRAELFPFSDVDLLFLHRAKSPDKAAKDLIRRMNQALWDAGLRVSSMTRALSECAGFDAENVEFLLSLMDARVIADAAGNGEELLTKVIPKLIARERKRITARLLEVTRVRHAKYGDTLFHLEPNIKECPGGLRDVNVCAWLGALLNEPAVPSPESGEARKFLQTTRTFLHLRHRRDDNTLDWHTQDQAAEAGLGISLDRGRKVDAGYWMRMYFRKARVVARDTERAIESVAAAARPAQSARASRPRGRRGADAEAGFEVSDGRIAASPASQRYDPAHDPDVALSIFAEMARTGAPLAHATERRLELGLPRLASHLEDGPALWHRLSDILSGAKAGRALRAMHGLGMLELVLPEFHGIDALVVRDAYHRYTVDEHTFVLIDVLHGLAEVGAAGGQTKRARRDPGGPQRQTAETGNGAVWAQRFAGLLRDLPHPALLFMAALLHDTGKGRAGGAHALESERLAAGVMQRLEVDSYEAALVLNLIRTHLEMSAAMRRDVFDRETISGLAAQIASPEALRMLTLFTYADICAVHPDALTPWKAENLWHLYVATASYLDRNVDDQRVGGNLDDSSGEVLHRVRALLPNKAEALKGFLGGFPQRYLATRSGEAIAAHFEMARRLSAVEAIQLKLEYAREMSTLTLVTRDRPRLFASVAGALAAWGMNIATAEGFSNAEGIVVDSFRFTDTYKTLELNQEERARFVRSVQDAIAGKVDVEKLLSARRRRRAARAKIKVQTRVAFEQAASTQSTLLEVIAQDTPGLLYSLALTLAEQGCNIEVALVDTEGETAIDVFYLTQGGSKLEAVSEQRLQDALLQAIVSNAGRTAA